MASLSIARLVIITLSIDKTWPDNKSQAWALAPPSPSEVTMIEQSDPGWTRADEEALGDHMQDTIRRDSPGTEDQEAERIMLNARQLWWSYDFDDE
jgi:hypothetical protein